MNRREVLQTTGLGVAGFVVGSAFTAPACDGVNKDKAVKYAGIAIDYLKDVRPILLDLGGNEVLALIDHAVPTLEKLKKALEDAEFPQATNFFDIVTDILGQVASALFQLPDTPRRMQVLAILTLVNITLRTVGLFVETTPMDNGARSKVMAVANKRAVTKDAMIKAFEATRF